MTDFDSKVLAAIPPEGTTTRGIRFVLGTTARTSKIQRSVKRLAKAGVVVWIDGRVVRK